MKKFTKTYVCLVLFCGICIYSGTALDCYECIGRSEHYIADKCFRGSSSVPTGSCNGVCVKYVVTVTDDERTGIVRRMCAPYGMTCDRIGEPLRNEVMELMVPENTKIAVRPQCKMCNTNYCNGAKDLRSYNNLIAITSLFGLWWRCRM